jgi:hypothetical protein
VTRARAHSVPSMGIGLYCSETTTRNVLGVTAYVFSRFIIAQRPHAESRVAVLGRSGIAYVGQCPCHR